MLILFVHLEVDTGCGSSVKSSCISALLERFDFGASSAFTVCSGRASGRLDLRVDSKGFGTMVDGAVSRGGGVGGGVSLSRAFCAGLFERRVVSTGCGRNCRVGGSVFVAVVGTGLMEK